MKNEMKRGLALLLCLAMVVGVFVGVPGMTTVANAAESTTTLATVPNGDFETPLNLANWTAKPGKEANVTVALGAGIGGSNALYIKDDVAAGSAGMFYADSDRMPVVAGTSYTLSAYIKGDMKTRLDLQWLDANGTVLSTNSATETLATTSWQQVSVTATAPEGAVYAQAHPFTGAGVTGNVYYDNVSFVAGADVVPGSPSGIATAWRNATNYTNAGFTVSYDRTTDTSTITSPGGATGTVETWYPINTGNVNAVSGDGITLPANTTYVLNFRISGSTASGEQGYIYVKDATAGTELGRVTFNGDGVYSLEFTTAATENAHRLYACSNKAYAGTYCISGLTVTLQTDAVLHNSGFEDWSFPGWTFTNNANTSWNPSAGNNSSGGITLTDTNTSRSISMVSDYIEIPEKFTRQIPVIKLDAKTDSTCEGFEFKATYYDANYNVVTSSEIWTGGGKTSQWGASASGNLVPTTSWATYTAYTHGVRYIPYGAKYMTITIVTGGVAKTGTVSVDNVTLQVKCGHMVGTHEDPTVAESALAHHEGNAASYHAPGSKEYFECANCGVKYTDAEATTVLSGDTTIAQYQVRENIRKGNSLSMIFGLDAAALTALDIDPATVTADIESVDGKSATVTELAYDSDNAIYLAEFTGIAAKEMSRTVTAKFYVNGEDEPFATHSASIRSYAFGCINDTTGTHTQTWKNCCIDMLNYGAAAQEHFDFGTDKNIILANKDLTATSGTEFAQDKSRKVTVGEDLFIASTIRFQCNLSMLFAVDATTEYTKAKISFTNHHDTLVEKEVTTAATQEVNGVNALCFEFNGMVVADIDSEITFTVYNGEEVVVQVIDSMDAYIGRVTNTESTMYALAQAFGKFATSAYDYHH